MDANLFEVTCFKLHRADVLLKNSSKDKQSLGLE
jgi:hypothetical protein